MAAPKVFGLASTQSSEILNAAEIVMAMLAATGTRSLDEMYSEAEEGNEKVIAKLATMSLTEEQINRIEGLGHHLKLIRTTPSVNLSECPECLGVTVVALAVKKCSLTLGCTGVPVKASKARRVPVETPAAA